MRSARGRRRIWRAAKRAAAHARDGDRAEETHCLAEEAKWEKWEREVRQTDSALKARCTWCCTCHKTQPLWHQQQQQPMQQQQQAPCSSSSSSSSSSKAKNTIVKERTWFNLVANEIVLHPLHLGTGALLHNEGVVATWSHGLHRCRICCSWTSLFCQWVWRRLLVP